MEFSLVTLEEKKANREMIVTQSNTLVEAKYYLSLYEQRLILMLISMVEPNDEDFKNYAIKVDDFRGLIGLKTKNLYPKVKSLLRGLRNKDIEIPKGGKNYLITGWISDAEYRDGIVYLSFSAKLKPYLIALKTNFTSHKLGVAIRFKGVYTIRIYTLLKQYERVGERVFSLEEFRDILGIKDGQYSQFFDFKRRTITQAQKELSEKKDSVFVSDINFNFEPIKTGRKITGLKFHIFEQSTKPKPAPKPPTLPPQAGTDHKKSDTPEIQEMLSIGIATKKALSLFEQYGVEYITEKLKITAEEDRPSPAGFFIKAVAEDWKSKAEKKKKKQDEARKKILEERQIERFKSATADLEKKFRNKEREKFLLSATQEEKEQIVKESREAQPAIIADMINDAESPMCIAILASKIPDYQANQKIFINAELKKLGLIKGGNQETDK